MLFVFSFFFRSFSNDNFHCQLRTFVVYLDHCGCTVSILWLLAYNFSCILRVSLLYRERHLFIKKSSSLLRCSVVYWDLQLFIEIISCKLLLLNVLFLLWTMLLLADNFSCTLRVLAFIEIFGCLSITSVVSDNFSCLLKTSVVYW